METKFKTLRLFAAIQVVIGVVFVAAAGIIVLIMAKVLGDTNDKGMQLFTGSSGVIIVIGLAMVGIASIAYGQFLNVIMQIEENTRR